jgi:hypothetical protein
MPAVTSITLIGRSHPNDGGLNPFARVDLVEGDRPVFIFQKMVNTTCIPFRTFKLWPTLEYMLDDLIFMILYLFETPVLVNFMEMKGLHQRCVQSKKINMFDDFSDEDRMELYRLVKANSDFSKIAICLFEDSSLKDSIKNLEAYDCDVEVLSTYFRREFSHWQNRQIIRGSLIDQPNSQQDIFRLT